MSTPEITIPPTASAQPIPNPLRDQPDFAVPADIAAEIDELITHYPQKRSASLMLLHAIQEYHGYISRQAVEWIAQKLELQPINVYEVVTFYPMFRQKPIGRRHIKVCRTLSCALMGGYKTCETFEKEFGTHRGEISPDGEVTIEFVECLASCGTAPVVLIDDDLHEKVDPARAKQLSDQIKQAAAQRGQAAGNKR